MAEWLTSSVATAEIRDGLLVYSYKDGAVIEEADARSTIALGAKLAANGPLPTLVLMSRVRRVAGAAREVFTSAENEQISRQVALVVWSPLSRVIGNFFLGLNKPKFPTRLFTAESAALEWLRQT
jgi:hypothetical protein